MGYGKPFLGAFCMVMLYQFAPVLAHAYLLQGIPASGSTVYETPKKITLIMSEPIEIRFSTFKVYPLEVKAEMSQRDIALAAKSLMEEVLLLRNDDEMRLDTGSINKARRHNKITIGLKEDLMPGTYVIMWRTLSIDTHSSEDFTFFTYQSSTEILEDSNDKTNVVKPELQEETP